MALQRFADLDDWELENPQQDIRERTLCAPTGEAVGVVKDLMVDLDDRRVAAVVTDAGESYLTAGLEIRADRVITHAPPVSGATSDYANLRPANAVAYDARLAPRRPSSA